LVQILSQSQPRISRHLKLMAEAGLIERFPDGAWVFYRLALHGQLSPLIDTVLDGVGQMSDEDRFALDQVRQERRKTADDYFESVASQWENIRSLYVSEAEVEAQILKLAGNEVRGCLVDLGTGTGRMLRLLSNTAKALIGLDLSQPMLNVARARAFADGLNHAEFRHGDIYDTRLPNQSADMVIAHQVMHFLTDPARAMSEAARILSPGGQLLIIDFAPHRLEIMRDQYRHRRLGLSDEDMRHWARAANLMDDGGFELPPHVAEGLTVKGWRLRKL